MLLVDVNERIYVTDFGLARRGEDREEAETTLDDADRKEGVTREYRSQAEAFETGSGALDEGLTLTGPVLGTPACIPPEI